MKIWICTAATHCSIKVDGSNAENKFRSRMFCICNQSSILFLKKEKKTLHWSFFADEGDTHLARTVPAVLRLHPQLLIPIDLAIGAASPLTVAALQLGQPRLGVVELRMSTRNHWSHTEKLQATTVSVR